MISFHYIPPCFLLQSPRWLSEFHSTLEWTSGMLVGDRTLVGIGNTKRNNFKSDCSLLKCIFNRWWWISEPFHSLADHTSLTSSLLFLSQYPCLMILLIFSTIISKAQNYNTIKLLHIKFSLHQKLWEKSSPSSLFHSFSFRETAMLIMNIFQSIIFRWKSKRIGN